MERGRGSNASSNSPGRGQPNPLDNLKQSCQNFFSNLTDNLSDSFAAFDGKVNAKPQENRRSSPNPHIFEQPRVSTREIPTYASSANGSGFTYESQTFFSSERMHVFTNDTPTATANANQSSSSPNTNQSSSSPNANQSSSSPSTSTKASSSNTEGSNNSQAQGAHHSPETTDENRDSKSDCECSDDEIIATFSELRTDASVRAKATEEPSSSDKPKKMEPVLPNAPDASSQSSFEELGAIGGISDESKATTDTNSSYLDQWQMLVVNRVEVHDEETPTPSAPPEEILEVTVRNKPDEAVEGEITQTVNIEQRPANPNPVSQPSVPQRSKKVTRRRSDGYLNRRHHSSDEESPVSTTGLGLGLSTLPEQPEVSLHVHGHRQSCQRCGKNKTNIRRHVEKMRRHLENAQMSEEDIKRELQDFLTYLEQRTKSLDASEADSHAVSPLSVDGISVAAGGRSPDMPITPTIEFSPTQDDDIRWDDDEGIHVYAAPSDFEPNACIDSRFVNLEDFEDL